MKFTRWGETWTSILWVNFFLFVRLRWVGGILMRRKFCVTLGSAVSVGRARCTWIRYYVERPPRKTRTPKQELNFLSFLVFSIVLNFVRKLSFREESPRNCLATIRKRARDLHMEFSGCRFLADVSTRLEIESRKRSWKWCSINVLFFFFFYFEIIVGGRQKNFNYLEPRSLKWRLRFVGAKITLISVSFRCNGPAFHLSILWTCCALHVAPPNKQKDVKRNGLLATFNN